MRLSKTESLSARESSGKEKQGKKDNGDIHKDNSRLKKEIAELKNANAIQDQFGIFVAELVNRARPEEIEKDRVSLKTSVFRGSQ
ncbi:MAG: hypothetical protein ACTTH7_04195 [Treponema sp.]